MTSINLKTVCLALGPYRNLTTLTASLLFLHPRCQVLNHGSDRILPNPGVNFLHEYSAMKFNAFLKQFIGMSAEGRRGRYGGSITLSHAFDDGRILETYKERFDETKIKHEIECLFWKESLRVSRFIQQHNINLESIFHKNSQLRFLMPMRNPVDCALSNIKTGHGNELVQDDIDLKYEVVLDAVLREFRWFVELQENFPGRFFSFYENSLDRNTVTQLADFLGIDPEKTWVDDVISNYNIRHPYEYTQEMKDCYFSLVDSHFDKYPAVGEQLAGMLY